MTVMVVVMALAMDQLQQLLVLLQLQDQMFAAAGINLKNNILKNKSIDRTYLINNI